MALNPLGEAYATTLAKLAAVRVEYSYTNCPIALRISCSISLPRVATLPIRLGAEYSYTFCPVSLGIRSADFTTRGADQGTIREY